MKLRLLLINYFGVNSLEDKHISTVMNDVLTQPQHTRSQESLMHKISTKLVYMRTISHYSFLAFTLKWNIVYLFLISFNIFLNIYY